MRVRTKPLNQLERCLTRHMRQSGITHAAMAKRLYVTQPTVTQNLKRPWRYWTLGQIAEYAEASGTPLREAMTAAYACMLGNKGEEQ